MRSKHAIAVALAVWLTSAAWVGLSASALPNHVVAGGVFGPGGDVTAGPTNPANAAWAYYYSTTEPTYSPVTEANIFDADGTDPAIFSEDVGAAWNWADGDEVVVVLETVGGVNGWAGANFTTSVDGMLLLGVPSQDFGDGEMEAIPTPSGAASGADVIDLSWTDLTDTNGNVVSYSVFRSKDGGAYSLAGQSASSSFSDTFLNAGTYCYVLGVDYRRDTIGGVFTTVGRSDPPVCDTVAGAPPFLVSTDPADGGFGVAPTAPIIVDFSEPMNIGSVTWTISPVVALTPGWSNGDRTVTLTHTTAFVDCTDYTVTITAGQDLDGMNLVAGTVPNPWTFSSNCPAPFIVSTTPADGATMVRTDADIVIEFSLPMNTGTVTYPGTPTLVSPSGVWSAGDTILTISHGGFTAGATYSITVSGSDTTGAALIPGPVANPFGFTVNTPPTVSLTSPTSADCWSGGSTHDITWTMSDPETSTANLVVDLFYFDGATTTTIVTGLTGATTHSWNLPSGVDSTTMQIVIDVTDEVGEAGTEFGAPFEIDSTAPTVTLTTPTGTTNVATDEVVVLTFSEPMDTAAVEGALTITPVVSSISFGWSSGDTIVTVTHAEFAVTTAYVVTLGTAATDACSPGNAIASEFTATFTTGTGPKRPLMATNLQAQTTTTAVTLTWDPPSSYTDGTSLASGDIANYVIYRAATETATPVQVGTANAPSFVDDTVSADTTYVYWVRVVDTSSRQSDLSAALSVTTPPPPGEIPLLLVVLIPVIVILLILGALLMMRRKKPTEAPVPEGEEPAPPGEPTEEPTEPAEAPPEPEGAPQEPASDAPAESSEAPAKAESTEQSGEKFIPCRNCGTMVKPTDAECFVCGTKL